MLRKAISGLTLEGILFCLGQGIFLVVFMHSGTEQPSELEQLIGSVEGDPFFPDSRIMSE